MWVFSNPVPCSVSVQIEGVRYQSCYCVNPGFCIHTHTQSSSTGKAGNIGDAKKQMLISIGCTIGGWIAMVVVLVIAVIVLVVGVETTKN